MRIKQRVNDVSFETLDFSPVEKDTCLNYLRELINECHDVLLEYIGRSSVEIL